MANCIRWSILVLCACLGIAVCVEDDALAKALAAVDSDVLTAEERKRWDEDLSARLREAIRRDSQAWAQIHSKEDWERFRDARMQKLRSSLSLLPPPAKELRVETTRRLDGDGFRIENLVFETRSGIVVTANLYIPEPARPKMPGIILSHSHHAPKSEGELQDMGVGWARSGCMVLVPDHIGHGERRQQPFGGRQDYHSRFYTGMQLHLAGESLMGWMAADLSRGVDVLLSRPGIDVEKIIIIGAVAGGGDPAAVTAELDPRITCAVPFNFGGPQPETRYPLPANAEETFNYAGGGSFESTRNLRLSVRDGFLPYAIVGALPPRALVYGHEFAWDQEHDPVWKRLQKLYGYYGAGDRLGSAHGFGNVRLKPPEASHCNNVGASHRAQIHPYFERWFGIAAPQEDKRQRRSAEELACLTDEARTKFNPKFVHELARKLSEERTVAARAALEALPPDARRKKLSEEWARLLGDIEARAPIKVEARETTELQGVRVERMVLQLEQRIGVPVVLLLPRDAKGKAPVVVAIAEEGKLGFLRNRAGDIAVLLRSGVAVCLADLRDTGERGLGDDSGRHRRTTDLSSTELMLGQTLLGSRLRDLRAVLAHLRTRPELDSQRLALWGDSFTPINEIPLEDQPDSKGKRPRDAKPLGAMMALFGALFESDVKAVIARRGLVGFESVFGTHFCYIPHDTVVPAALTAGDLCDIAAALAPRPVSLEGLVDGRNCLANDSALQKFWAPAKTAYAQYPGGLNVSLEFRNNAASWLLAALNSQPLTPNP